MQYGIRVFATYWSFWFLLVWGLAPKKKNDKGSQIKSLVLPEPERKATGSGWVGAHVFGSFFSHLIFKLNCQF